MSTYLRLKSLEVKMETWILMLVKGVSPWRRGEQAVVGEKN
jgi:hypothetical protein